jgi:hypothetical protein
MSTMRHSFRYVAVCFALALVTGCESTDGGSSSVNVGGYHGVGFYDPWYYGGYHDHDVDIDINPPDRPNRPDRPVRPEQPIARPPDVSSRPAAASPKLAVRPMPSIPSTPAPAFRGGGGGGGRR